MLVKNAEFRTYTHSSAQNNSWKLVGHSFKVGTLLQSSPLEMYSKICPPKLDLFSRILKQGWRKQLFTGPANSQRNNHSRRKGLKVGGAEVLIVAAKVDPRCRGLGHSPQMLTKVSFFATLK